MNFRIAASCLLGVLLLFAVCVNARADGPYFANGIKVGEATADSAIVWVRLTKNKTANLDLLPIFTEGLPGNKKINDPMPIDVVPGMAGQVRIRYWINGKAINQRIKNWQTVSAESDFTHQFRLNNLRPDTRYQLIMEARTEPADQEFEQIMGYFRTAPKPTDSVPVKFVVTTCQAVRSIDSGPDGHISYDQMRKFDPHFFVHTGDIVYYDKVPLAKNIAQARAKWNLMFAYGHNLKFHRYVSSYFMKDDHDTLKNDCWPGQKYGELTFEDGLKIFREQVPMGEKTYRTVRWGKDLQIWMTENRDFRSANNIADGPAKTILGSEQKAWLKKTIAESDATFKFVITPGPIVGPDKKGKNDNHSNIGFATEGQELRDFIATQKNTYVICGDRHWQYCSRDPKTGILEMGCGPINDQHMFGGNPGDDPAIHRYFSAKGGFLGVTIDGASATAEWFHSGELDQETGQPKVLHTEKFPLND